MLARLASTQVRSYLFGNKRRPSNTCCLGQSRKGLNNLARMILGKEIQCQSRAPLLSVRPSLTSGRKACQDTCFQVQLPAQCTDETADFLHCCILALSPGPPNSTGQCRAYLGMPILIGIIHVTLKELYNTVGVASHPRIWHFKGLCLTPVLR